MIGYRMREECRARGVPHDIEVDEDKRIYGDAWYLFLSNCRAVLGTESGSNILTTTAQLDRPFSRRLFRIRGSHMTRFMSAI